MIRHTHSLALVIWLVLLLVATPVYAQTATVEPTAAPMTVIPDADPLAEAQALHAQTITNINSYLTFLQTLTGVVGFVGILGAIIGITGFFDLRRHWTSIKSQGDTYLANIKTTQDNLATQSKELEQRQRELAQFGRDLQQRMNDFERVRADLEARFQSAIQALALAQLASRQVDIGNLNAARDTLMKARALEPNNHVLNYFLGDLFLREGEINQGMTYLAEARKVGAFLPADATFAYALRLAGDQETDTHKRAEWYAQAEAEFLKVYHLDSKLLDISGESAFGALAGLYRRRGDIESALHWYEHCRSTTRNNSYPVNNLGLLHYRYHKVHPKADRDIGKNYFALSKRRAKAASVQSYWRHFDLIVAESVLDEITLDEIILLIDDALAYDPPDVDIDKLLDGLRELAQANDPSKLIAPVIDEIERRR